MQEHAADFKGGVTEAGHAAGQLTEAAAVQCVCQQGLVGCICVLEDGAGNAVPAGDVCLALVNEDVLEVCLDLLPAPHRHVPEHGVWPLLSILRVGGRC